MNSFILVWVHPKAMQDDSISVKEMANV